MQRLRLFSAARRLLSTEKPPQRNWKRYRPRSLQPEQQPSPNNNNKGPGKGPGDNDSWKSWFERASTEVQKPNNLLTAGALLFYGSYLFSGSSSEDQDGNRGLKQGGWKEVREDVMQGRVSRVEVVNGKYAKVFLKNENGLEDANSSKERYRFEIGSASSLERKLELAQEDAGIRPADYVPIVYVEEESMFGKLMDWLPTVLLVGTYFYAARRLGGGRTPGRPPFGPGAPGARPGSPPPGMPGGPFGGGAGGIFSMGKSTAKIYNKDNSKVTTNFKDVAGLTEAKQEIMEFVDFLKKPERYKNLGAKIPKGALMYGPPGTGKTLLAKATAGEAGVPFLTVSGSDFMEMFVGVGPGRVRDLFAQARSMSPCIVFIDEIDAIGRKRGRGGFVGGNDERENTLNQLLVEMDGFSPNAGIVVLAGTNRSDVLDNALLRPGRFDRQISIDAPDIAGRKEIFDVHLRKIKVQEPPGKDEVAKQMAARTPGFVGADIANVCNEAALIAARHSGETVALPDFDAAVDRVIGGLEKKNMVMSPEEKKTIAYHEAGHAVTGWFLEHAMPLLKVSIVPRGTAALGYAQYQPIERLLYSREALLDHLCMTLGGRASEELFFDTVTSGASDDFNKVTKLAYQSVTQWGLGKTTGLLSFPSDDQNPEGASFYKPYSNSLSARIDREVRSIVSEAYQRTKSLLAEKKNQVAAVAELLLKKEAIGREDMVGVLGERPFETEKSSYDDIIEAAKKKQAEEGNASSQEPQPNSPAPA